MEKSIQFSTNVANNGSYGFSGYYKLDLPTGESKIFTGKVPICRCEKSQNKPFCDESHAKCVNGIVTPWFF
jgi:CDGSH-type Zn-finger protein